MRPQARRLHPDRRRRLLLAALAGGLSVGLLGWGLFGGGFSLRSAATPSPTAPLVLPETPTVTLSPTLEATVTPSVTVTATRSPTPTVAPTGTRPAASPDAASRPDLVVGVFGQAGQPSIGPVAELAPDDDLILVPVRVTVTNRGASPAPVFKLAASYELGVGTSTGSEAFVVPFVVADQRDHLYPFTSAPLAPGSGVSLSGQIVLPLSTAGQSVVLRVTADSCSGEAFQSPSCRAQESNEGNNVSAPLRLELPMRRSVTPGLTPTATRTPTVSATRTATPSPVTAR